MATYDPAVKAALQKALPGYTVTDADATWWTNNGGVAAVTKQWPQQFMEAEPAGTMVNPRPAGDATVSEWQPAAGAEDIARRNAIRSAFSQLTTQEDLDKFLVNTRFTPEQISEVFPQYAVADLKRERERAFQSLIPQSTLDPELKKQVDAFVRPRMNELRMQGTDFNRLYTDPAYAQWAARQLQPNTGPEVMGGYHTTTGGYVQPPPPVADYGPPATPAPSTTPGMMNTGGSSNPFFGGGQPWPGDGGSSGPNPFLNMGGGGMMGGGGYVPFSSLLQPFGQSGFDNFGFSPMQYNFSNYGQGMFSGFQQPFQQGPATWEQQAYRPNLPPGLGGTMGGTGFGPGGLGTAYLGMPGGMPTGFSGIFPGEETIGTPTPYPVGMGGQGLVPPGFGQQPSPMSPAPNPFQQQGSSWGQNWRQRFNMPSWRSRIPSLFGSFYNR